MLRPRGDLPIPRPYKPQRANSSIRACLHLPIFGSPNPSMRPHVPLVNKKNAVSAESAGSSTRWRCSGTDSVGRFCPLAGIRAGAAFCWSIWMHGSLPSVRAKNPMEGAWGNQRPGYPSCHPQILRQSRTQVAFSRDCLTDRRRRGGELRNRGT